MQIIYAKHLLVEIDANLDRLQAAARACHQAAAGNLEARPGFAQRSARGADLCERAAQIVIDSGAAR